VAAWAVTAGSLLALFVALMAWTCWYLRRDLRSYRRRCGGRWGLVRGRASAGMEAPEWWLLESEIGEGQSVLRWEEWPRRTRVRRRGDA